MVAITMRIDLRPVGRVVLIEVSNKWEPFQITKHDINNRRVQGVWLLTDIKDYIHGDTPTLNFNDKWVGGYVKTLKKESKKINNRIIKLEKLFNLIK